MGVFLYSGIVAKPTNKEQLRVLEHACKTAFKKVRSEHIVGSYLVSPALFDGSYCFFLVDVGSKMGWELRNAGSAFEKTFFELCNTEGIAAYSVRIGGDDDQYGINSYPATEGYYTMQKPQENLLHNPPADITRIIVLSSGLFPEPLSFSNQHPSALDLFHQSLEGQKRKANCAISTEHFPHLFDTFDKIAQCTNATTHFQLGAPLGNALCNAMGVIEPAAGVPRFSSLDVQSTLAALHAHLGSDSLWASPKSQHAARYEYPYNWCALSEHHDGAVRVLHHSLSQEERTAFVQEAQSVLEQADLEQRIPQKTSRRKAAL